MLCARAGDWGITCEGKGLICRTDEVRDGSRQLVAERQREGRGFGR